MVGIEIIDDRRSAQTFLEALYIVEPTRYNIDCIAADYTRVPPRYAGANIFVTSGLNDDLNRKLQNSAIGRHLRILEQACIDFIPLESHTFTLGDPAALEKFYNESCADLLQRVIRKIARQLVSVCVTLGEYPIIRFYDADNSTRPSRKLPYMIAREFQNELDAYVHIHSEFLNPSEGRPRAVFLILDRSIDWIAPLLHEFTYQAAVYDLLPIKNWQVYKYMENIMGQEQPNEGKVSEKDPEWVALRHTHMERATVTLGAKLEKLKKDNPHLADASKQAKISDLKDMMLNLPMFNETRARYTFHVAMASGCMDEINRRNLIDLAMLEQICATGTVEDDKTKPAGLADEFVTMLADDRLENKDKVRLIMLYAIYRYGLVEGDFEKLRLHCGLTQEDMAVIHNYTKLGAPVLKSLTTENKTEKDVPTRFNTHATGDYLQMSRYVPAVCNIVDRLARGVLPADLFPYIKDQPTEEDELDANTVSLRNPRQRAVWARTANAPVVTQRIFVFMAGGITASETRSCYEVSKLQSKEVIIGGTDFTAGPQFLKSLFRLGMDRKQLGLEEDQPVNTKAPSYLMESDRESQPKQQQQTQPLPLPVQLAPKPYSSMSSLSSTQSDAMLKTKDKKRGKLGRFFK